jgi:pyruvate carboxylase subunit A
MRIVKAEKDFREMFESATNESMKYFGRGEVFIEKYVENPRHIEIQVIADKRFFLLHNDDESSRYNLIINLNPKF